ncbi:rhomboid family intramembrane serine protease [Pseudotenacibaculum haliotis]|uniref:Rhomboid family intramembrane serine protease n=1 Tax=Pseudotenacibaculum haliotis TaxID=1862138 RepID=A0ABW5LPV1_9FLAO
MFWIPIAFVFAIWFVYWFEIQYNFNFNKYGILPREFSGLRGVFFSPFIHSDTQHLFNNSIPLFVLSLCLMYFYEKVAYKVLLIGLVLTGLFTWIIARESYHIGASGIVYLLFSFVFFSGIFKNHFRLIAVSLITIFLYGSMIWFVFPTEGRISWEGHLSGFVVGLILAFLFRRKGLVKEEYKFSQTEFDLLFDENGNLIQEQEENPVINADE